LIPPDTSEDSMTATADPIEQLANALSQVSVLIDGIRPDQVDAPTPCASWDVATLASHVVHDLDQFTATASGEEVDWSAPAPPLSGSWVGQFDEKADALMTAWRHHGASDAISMQIAELAVHAWDLARATDQHVSLDPSVAQTGLAWMQSMLQPQFRGSEDEGKSFGPEVPAPNDAPVYDRLVAFSGRTP
jgi:uncharacterized protein (TIGR03086 family)